MPRRLIVKRAPSSRGVHFQWQAQHQARHYIGANSSRTFCALHFPFSLLPPHPKKIPQQGRKGSPSQVTTKLSCLRVLSFVVPVVFFWGAGLEVKKGRAREKEKPLGCGVFRQFCARLDIFTVQRFPHLFHVKKGRPGRRRFSWCPPDTGGAWAVLDS